MSRQFDDLNCAARLLAGEWMYQYGEARKKRKRYDYVTLRLSASYCVAAEHMSKEHESLEQGLLDQGQSAHSTTRYGIVRQSTVQCAWTVGWNKNENAKGRADSTIDKNANCRNKKSKKTLYQTEHRPPLNMQCSTEIKTKMKWSLDITTHLLHSARRSNTNCNELSGFLGPCHVTNHVITASLEDKWQRWRGLHGTESLKVEWTWNA